MPEPIKENVQIDSTLLQQMIDNDRCSVTADLDLLKELVETGVAPPPLIEEIKNALARNDELNDHFRELLSQQQENTDA